MGLALPLQAHAASGCRVSLPEPLQAAFEARRLGFAGRIWLQHNRTPGPELLHLLRTLSCSLHLLSDEPEAPKALHNKPKII